MLPNPRIDIPPQRTEPQHTRITFLNPPPPIAGFPLTPFTAKQKPMINIAYINGGDFTLHVIKQQGLVSVEPIKEAVSVFHRRRQELNHSYEFLGGTINPHWPEATYRTFVGPELTDEQARQLNNGESALCAIGLVIWADSSGRYETQFAGCYTSEMPVASGFNWHADPESNSERKLH